MKTMGRKRLHQSPERYVKKNNKGPQEKVFPKTKYLYFASECSLTQIATFLRYLFKLTIFAPPCSKGRGSKKEGVISFPFGWRMNGLTVPQSPDAPGAHSLKRFK